LFENGQLTGVGTQVTIPENALRIDVTGRHVYPGLFNAGGQLGLVEIDAARATIDFAETGSINPNVRAEVAINPDSELIPVTRTNGVLLVLSVPTGGLISGTSAVLRLDGWTSEELTLKSLAGMHVHWPSRPSRRPRDADAAEAQQKEHERHVQLLRDTFDNAVAYRQARQANPQAHPIDVRLEAMIPVLKRDVPLVVHADGLREIQAAVTFGNQYQCRVIIYGGYDAELCRELLRQHDVPVIVSSVYRLPRRRSDEFDRAYSLPHRLWRAGIKFCIAGVGRFEASNLRNLPYHAATAVAYGLPEEEAIKAITLYPAAILGVADRVGSLEVGKDATLIVTDGNPLETPTQVLHAFVSGRAIQLNDRQQMLWKKYREKYRQQSAPGP
jgi:imidazolonepropionase-like amidohydrolase